MRRAILRWVSYFIVLGLILAVYLGGLAFLFAAGHAGDPGRLGGRPGGPVGPAHRLAAALPAPALRRKFRRDLNTARETILGNLRETRKRFSEEAILDRPGRSPCARPSGPILLLLLPAEDRTDSGCPPLPSPIRTSPPGGPPRRAAHALRLPQALLRHARENRELVLGLQSDEADWIREQGPALRAHVDALEAQVLALIMVNEEPYAALVLGGKYAELNYGREDRELLREVAIATGHAAGDRPAAPAGCWTRAASSRNCTPPG